MTLSGANSEGPALAFLVVIPEGNLLIVDTANKVRIPTSEVALSSLNASSF